MNQAIQEKLGLGKKLLNTLKKENKSLFRAFPYFFWFVAHWVIGDVTLVCLCLKGDVCVCESFFLIFILGVNTNHWFYIRCDWSLIYLIRFNFCN